MISKLIPCNDQSFWKEFRKLLDLPENMTSLTLYFEMGSVVTAEITYYVTKPGETKEITRRYSLVETEDPPKRFIYNEEGEKVDVSEIGD